MTMTTTVKRSIDPLLFLSPLANMLIPLLLLLLFTWHPVHAVDSARSIQIMNESSRRVEVHWIHPDTGELVLQSTPDILHGASFALNSFVGHAFEVRELPTKKTGVCGGEEEACRVDYFTVNKNQDQVIMIKDGVEVEHTDSKTIASKSASNLLDDCKSVAKRQLSSDPESAGDILEDLAKCVQKGVAVEIERANEEIAFQATVRKDMAALVENYTCADETLNSTEAKRIEYWENWDGDNRRRQMKVQVMIDRPASKIHTIENFLTADECRAVEETAAPLLHDATVADGSGGSKLSESRKAKQAGIKVNWEKEADGDLIARLSRRVYDYVNHVLPFDIKENGQEDLMSIQYFGRGPDDEAPDRYMPHCDGDCNGLDFKPGNRMATIVMYCDVPRVGGATRFRNSNVHIRPKKYAATFFSYIDPVSMKMDSGFTEHSGCPVVEGEKKIVTQWVRLGVDDENPWNSFNTLGIKYSEAENQ
eukprot:CAMPEP_0172535056 /NCGR_PEP_ID=MMETSP1067-20121228/7220_1 /TAXON_ID=265564 ORGANISM="Thalassiosira punctigera, Strain Tpunct2005C2" /NCGR_SAMPLE_ID=MMETSP1067 /ASSEMBLY_ACC=CAM_ASM_000444 /LENGTH=477 /DNA_ID=CAMNT_0013319949 /DNA_START=14 /DNA_END=1447 /DNA_ORIENTATION=+